LTFDELKSRNIFRNQQIIFMSVIVESHGLTVIGVNT
jgi:hypothetical protein